jgi:hypothetical protein
MNRLFIIAIGLLISNTLCAEFKMIWNEKNSTKEFIDFYADFAERETIGNVVQIPFYYNHDGPQEYPVMSSGGIAELNCKEKKGRTIFFTVFTEKDLNGQKLTEMKLPNEKWKVLGKTEKPLDVLFKKACQ